MKNELKAFIKTITFVFVPVFICGCIFQVTILDSYAKAKLINVNRSPAVITKAISP